MSTTHQTVTGTVERETYILKPAHVAKNKIVLLIENMDADKSFGATNFKTRGARLAEQLGGKWTGRDRGYLLSPGRAELWRQMFLAGFDAPYFAYDGARVDYQGKEMSVKEATALLKTLPQAGPKL